jgi:hypothetical protein
MTVLGIHTNMPNVIPVDLTSDVDPREPFDRRCDVPRRRRCAAHDTVSAPLDPSRLANIKDTLMPIRYSEDRLHRRLRTQAEGVVTFDDINAHLDIEQRDRTLDRPELVDPRWTGQNRPFVDTSKPANSGERIEASEFYRTLSPDGKSVWSFVRQLRGPHFSTCA